MFRTCCDRDKWVRRRDDDERSQTDRSRVTCLRCCSVARVGGEGARGIWTCPSPNNVCLSCQVHPAGSGHEVCVETVETRT